MSRLNVGDRVRLITRPAERKAFGIIDARQAGVYRVKLDNGETVLVARHSLAFQSSANSATSRGQS